MNKLLKWSNYFSDHNIFIASWLQDLEIYQRNKPSNIILNGADRDIFKSYGFSGIKSLKDLNGHNRVCVGQLNKC